MSRKRPTERESDRVTETASIGDEPAERQRCTICDDPVRTSDWHPALARYEDGDFEVHLFCSADCRENWNGELS